MANYYVTAINGKRRYVVAGPFSEHATALDFVDPIRRFANNRDPFSWFYAWGTASSGQRINTPLGSDPSDVLSEAQP